MKVFYLNFLLVVFALTICDTRVPFESEDVDKILSDNKALTEYLNCLKNVGPCTPAQQDFVDQAPIILGNYCADCTPSKKNFVKKLTTYVIKNQFEEWRKVQKRFDPDLSHADDFNKKILNT